MFVVVRKVWKNIPQIVGTMITMIIQFYKFYSVKL